MIVELNWYSKDFRGLQSNNLGLNMIYFFHVDAIYIYNYCENMKMKLNLSPERAID